MTATMTPNTPDTARARRPPKVRTQGSRRRSRSSIRRSSGRRSSTPSRSSNPRTMMRNPVMFIVEVGSVLTTVICSSATSPAARAQQNVFAGLVVAVAVVHGAVRQLRRGDGRGSRQGAGRDAAQDAGRDHRPGPHGRRNDRRDAVVGARSSATCASSRAGEVIPGDGDIVEGIATVDESAITGESAPVIRESGGDRSAVTGGTRVLSDEIVVRITAKPGETFLDRMIALVEGADRQKTPNEIALSILLAGLTIIFLLAVVTLQPFAIYSGAEQSVIVLVALLVCLIPTTIGGLLSSIGIAGMDRLVQRNVLAMSGRAVEAAGDVHHAAARQDRHDHLRLAPGRRVHPGPRRRRARPRRGRAGLVARRRDARGPLDRANSPSTMFWLRSDRRSERRCSCRSPPRPACRAWT